MTDYSSNESSNDNVYDLEYRDETWPATDFKSQTSAQTENLFSGNLMANPSPVNFNFEALKQLKKTESSTTTLQQPLRPNSLLKSAIKSNSKRKMRRLYCRDKRIPFWAEDLGKVGRSNRNMDPNRIFGRCVVENLNAEYLFPTTQ